VKKLITETELRALAGDSKQVVIPSSSILTPSALDMAKFMNLTLQREEATPVSAAGSEPSVEEIRRIVKMVLEQKTKPVCTNPRVTHVQGSSIKLEPFDQAPPGQIIHLKDVVTSREGNLAAGFMTFDHSELPWHLTYDEVDYVVEGTFTLQANGKTYTCQAGDVMYIPKDTHVVFGSPAHTRVFYVTYPANWAEG
jgi:ethanolamine utilization protein EutQ